MGILNKIGVIFEEGTFKDNQLGWYVVTPDKYHNNISEIFSFEIRKKEKEHMIFFFWRKKGSDIENYPKKYYKKLLSS